MKPDCYTSIGIKIADLVIGFLATVVVGFLMAMERII
jgi:hypothetical protein